MRNTSQLSKLVLALVMLTSAILSILRFNSFQVGAFTDDAHYVVLAESLASGQGYRLINFPDPPVERNFPFGWSLVLSPIAALFPNNFTALKLLSFAFWLASIPLAYRLFAPRIATPYLEILIALIALNPVLGVSGMLMSEVAYLFSSLLALNILDYWGNHNQKDWLLVVVVAAALCTQLIRTVGISILLMLILYLLVSRRFRQLAIAVAITALGMLPQFWLNSQSGGSVISSGYESQVFGSPLLTKPAEMWQNVQAYFGEMISNSLVPVFGPNIASAFSKFGLGIIPPLLNVLILLILALGVILSFRQFKASDLYVALYFVGILTFWNPQVGSAQDRFLIPLIPFLYFYLLQAIIWLARHVPNLKARYVPVVVLGLASFIVLFSVARNIQDWQSPIRNRMTDLSIGTTWIRENTPQQSIVMVRDPVPDYLYARRKTVAYPRDGQDVEKTIVSNGVNYIMLAPKLQTPRTYDLDDFAKSNLLPLLTSNSSRFRLVWSDAFNNVSVYEVRNH